MYGFLFLKTNKFENRLIHGWRIKVPVKTSSIFIIVEIYSLFDMDIAQFRRIEYMIQDIWFNY